nr:uncharacterized protein LOC112016496 isoform X3 [Quercus suber]
MQSEPFPVERQILGSNPSLIRGGTTSYSFWNHHWKHKLGKIKSSTLLAVVQNTKPKGEQPPGKEYQNLLLYLKSTITIPMSHAAKLVSMSALTIQKLPMQLLHPKYSLLTVTK